MAGGQLWGVWVQPVTGDTSPENIEKYGEIEDMAQAFRDGFARDFCDGQTSPVPPRWPDDNMQLLYFYDRESAQLISEYLRGSLRERFDGGELPTTLAPTWLDNLSQMAPSSTTEGALLMHLVERAAESSEPAAGAIAEMTRSQLRSRLRAYIRATGDMHPSADDLLQWLIERGEA